MLRLLSVCTIFLTMLLTSAAGADEKSSPLRILAFGDSLFAGFGLPAEEGFTNVLQSKLNEDSDQTIVVENAGVPGDTTSGGLARLDWSLASKPDFVMVELGANDALRGLPPENTKANLSAILDRLKEGDADVLLVGMRASPTMGEEYVAKFDAIYPALAAQYEVPLYPFFLEGVAAEPSLNQSDGLHPNAEGVKKIVKAMLPTIRKSLPER